MKFHNFGYLLKEGVKNLWKNRTMSIASIGVLISCLLLTGCGVPGEAHTQSSDTSEELSTETTTEPIKEASLLDSCEAFDDSGALWYIPNQ